MITSEPLYCRKPAFEMFAAAVEIVESDSGLVQAAVAIAAHDLHDAKVSEVAALAGALADRVRRRVRSDDADALLAHLHVVLFEEEGFAGNPSDYYNPRNSYLPSVFESKRGIPISLVLVYKCVAARLGVLVEGINSPGHFLAKVEMNGKPALVDPFYGGRVLTRDEAIRQIEQMTGTTIPTVPSTAEDDPMFQVATHREWVARMLRNLRAIYAHTGRDEDGRAMQELFSLL